MSEFNDSAKDTPTGEWYAQVYILDEPEGEFGAVALACFKTESGTVFADREGVYLKPLNARRAAGDYAMVLNSNRLTPSQLGTSKLLSDYPAGRIAAPMDFKETLSFRTDLNSYLLAMTPKTS